MVKNQWNHENVESYSQYDNSELDKIHPALLEMLGDIRGKSVADYGCGEGKFLAELLDNGAKVKGYDTSRAMIEQSRTRIGNQGELDVIESGKIPLPNNSLDSVVSNLVLMMCPSKEGVKDIFKEINRVLVPNGSWVYCVTHPAFIDQKFTTYRNIFNGGRDYFNEGQSYQFVLRKKDGSEVTDDSFIDHNYSLSTYLNLLPQTGFNFKELKEISVEGNSLPPYIIVKGDKI